MAETCYGYTKVIGSSNEYVDVWEPTYDSDSLLLPPNLFIAMVGGGTRSELETVLEKLYPTVGEEKQYEIDGSGSHMPIARFRGYAIPRLDTGSYGPNIIDALEAYTGPGPVIVATGWSAHATAKSVYGTPGYLDLGWVVRPLPAISALLAVRDLKAYKRRKSRRTNAAARSAERQAKEAAEAAEREAAEQIVRLVQVAHDKARDATTAMILACPLVAAIGGVSVAPAYYERGDYYRQRPPEIQLHGAVLLYRRLGVRGVNWRDLPAVWAAAQAALAVVDYLGLPEYDRRTAPDPRSRMAQEEAVALAWWRKEIPRVLRRVGRGKTDTSSAPERTS